MLAAAAILGWLTDPSRQAELTAIGFIVSMIGTALTLIGLGLTFYQVRRAAVNTRRIAQEIDDFEFRKKKSDAVVELGTVKLSLESAVRLIKLDSWKDALSNYDEARKCIINVKLVADDLSVENNRKLKSISDHINSFCSEVENALGGKRPFPDKTNLSINNRRNFDDMTVIQNELQKLSR